MHLRQKAHALLFMLICETKRLLFKKNTLQRLILQMIAIYVVNIVITLEILSKKLKKGNISIFLEKKI